MFTRPLLLLNAVSIKQNVCLYCCLIYSAQTSHRFCTVLLTVSPSVLPYFFTPSDKQHNYMKYVWFSLQILSKTFLILSRIQWDIMNVCRCSCKVPFIYEKPSSAISVVQVDWQTWIQLSLVKSLQMHLKKQYREQKCIRWWNEKQQSQWIRWMWGGISGIYELEDGYCYLHVVVVVVMSVNLLFTTNYFKDYHPVGWEVCEIQFSL